MAATPSWPIIEQVYSKANVFALQCLLNFKNKNNNLALDGVFGSKTHSAVVAYQGGNGLLTDGRAGPKTLSKLIDGVLIKDRTTNSAARAAQHLLSKFEKIDIDGDFGPKSAESTKAFQKKMKILVDGVIGPVSWQYLFGYDSYPADAIK